MKILKKVTTLPVEIEAESDPLIIKVCEDFYLKREELLLMVHGGCTEVWVLCKS